MSRTTNPLNQQATKPSSMMQFYPSLRTHGLSAIRRGISTLGNLEETQNWKISSHSGYNT